MKVAAILSLLAILQAASTHSIFTQLNGNPVSYAIRDPSSDYPLQDVTSNDIVCNGGENPTTASSDIITVSAGSTVQATWRHTLNSDSSDVIDPSHKGPVVAYMKKVSDATTDPGYGDGWFKVQEDGFSGGAWGVDRLIASGGVQDITIPACVTPGQYLLRAEIIALHQAGTSGGAQFFMECAQISVTGGGGTKIPSTVSFPGAYSATDPGILLSIYYPTVTNYTVPGPAVFTC